MATKDDITRGLNTYTSTGSSIAGFGDLIFGDDPDNPQDINRDTTVNQLTTSATTADQTTNQSALTQGATDTLTGSTALTDQTTNNIGLQNQAGTQGIGAFTGQTGLGTSGFDPVTGQFNSQLDPSIQQGLVNPAMQAAGGAYGQLNNFNFNDTMGQRYNALEALQEQDRQQARMNLEDRLFSQGRLGSTGGALSQNALLDAIMQQQSGNANTAFGQAMAQRQQFGDQATQFGQNALAPQQMSLQQLSAMGALAPQVSNNQISTNNLSNTLGTNTNTGFQNTSNTNLTNTSGQQQSNTLGLQNIGELKSIRTV